MRVVRAHGADLCLEATEVERVFVVEHDVGVAMPGVLEQFLVELGARREQRHQVHARACGDVFDLGFRADQLRVLRKCMRAHVVFRVHVSGDDVDRFAGSHLGDFALHGFGIACAHAGIDHQHSLLADHDADVGHQREALPSGIAQT